MKENKAVEKTAEDSRPPRGAARRHPGEYSFEIRRQAVRLHLEEGFTLALVAREMGLSRETVFNWVKRFRQYGEQGLKVPYPYPSNRKARMAPVIKEQIVALKQQHPGFGVKRIAQFLKRMLFLSASPETVRRTLHEQQLIPKTRRKPRRNTPRRGSSSVQHPTRCGRATSSPFGWAARTPT